MAASGYLYKARYKLLMVLAVVLLLLLQYRLWIASGNVIETRHLKQQLASSKLSNETQLQQNNAMAAEINMLKTGLSGVEAKAREELGMVKPDETFFFIVDAEPGSE